jgi:hypothetical protein
MKALITILIVVGVAFGAYKIWEYWDNVEHEREMKANAPQAEMTGDRLPGLPQKMEPALKDAEKGGAKTLKTWLDKVKPTGVVKDPRLAWIELDYVLMITKDDPVEAKRIFADVKQRTPPDSPVLARIKALEKNYE